MTDNIKLLYIDLFCGAGGTRVNIEAWSQELMRMMMGDGKGYQIPIEDE